MALTDKQLQAIAIQKLNPAISASLIASQCGIGVETVRNWKKNPEFNEWMEKAETLNSTDYLRDVTWLKAAQGDTASLKTYMQYWGQEAGGVDEFAEAMNMTEPVLEQIALDAYEYIKAKRAA